MELHAPCRRSDAALCHELETQFCLNPHQAGAEHGQRADGVYVIPLPCETARYLVVYRGEYYALALKDGVREFLRERLGAEVEIRPCQ